ncbi:hypothetical protein [Nonomuraea rosea]|uniref:hypothetical protein n=1 Tax=Nonomuraea rosea TaxID=638574 RepID=UPI0031EF6BB3
MSQLRKTLGGRIATTTAGYALAVPEEEVDLGRFRDPAGQRPLQADPAGRGQRGPVRRAAQPVHHSDGGAPGRALD